MKAQLTLALEDIPADVKVAYDAVVAALDAVDADTLGGIVAMLLAISAQVARLDPDKQEAMLKMPLGDLLLCALETLSVPVQIDPIADVDLRTH